MNRNDNQSDIRRDRAQTLRKLPAVHRVLAELGDVDLPRPLVVEVVRKRLDALREMISDQAAPAPDIISIGEGARRELKRIAQSRFRTVINGTGVIIHTNLGRSPLSERAVEAVARAAGEYVNLEYDVELGERGRRGEYVEHALALLCGAEAACVVNNCAAALVLILRHFAGKPPRNHVVISRGELVQIGGGFRVPEILEASGASLREVGTTNKTTIDDYAQAVDQNTSMILRVHRSNFYMGGFVESPTSHELATLAREKGVPLVEDLGSGAIFDTSDLGGGEREPTPQSTLGAGTDLVTFSGDKLFGGPQAGIIAGAERYVEALKREPFFRALRCDKLVLAALEATVEALLDVKADEVPIRRMMQTPLETLQTRAQRIVAALGHKPDVWIGHGQALAGGGSLPRTTIPSVTIDLSGKDPQDMARRLRSADPPVIGVVSEGLLKLDLRTIFPRQDDYLISAIRSVLSQ
jgi:L-seryl-tRNA(Ser) seleniumtransferase